VIRRGGALALIALIGSASLAGGAQAATVHIGSPLTADFVPGDFSAQQVTIVQRTLPEPGVNIINPVDGHIVSYQLGPSNGTFALQVIRYSGTMARSVVTSPLTQVNTAGLSQQIPTDLAIKRGDLIGIKIQGGSDLLAGASNGSVFSVWSPALDDGADPRDPDASFGNTKGVEFGFGATVRYCQVPKVLGKNPKEARQALTAADCTVGNVTKTKKTAKRKKVIGQSVAAGNAISDTAAIDLKVARKRG
jgi:PASTA domain-containing protein